MNLVITLTAAGADTGPFNIYSNVDGYANAFETNISKASLLAGFASSNVPVGTTEVRVKSVNDLCNNYGIGGTTPLSYRFLPDTTGERVVVDFVESGNTAYVYSRHTGYQDGTTIWPGNKLIKIKADRTADRSFDTGTGLNNEAFFGWNLKEQPDGKLIVTGQHTSYNGTATKRIMRLNTDGSIDNTFNIGTGFNNYTTDMIQNLAGEYYVLGIFTMYDGLTSPGLVKILNDGSKDPTFLVGTGFNNVSIWGLINDDQSFYVTGYFNAYNGTTVPTGIAKLLPDGTLDPSFVGGTGFNVGDLLTIAIGRNTAEQSFYCAGYFTTYKGIAEPHIIKLTETGDKDVTFDAGTGFDDNVWTMWVVFGDKILCVGDFTTYDGTASVGCVLLNPDGTILQAFPLKNYYIYVIGNNIFGALSGQDNQIIYTNIP